MNRIFAKEDFLWYNFSIKGDFTVINSLFEQFRGIYTQQGDYLLPNLILPAEKNRLHINMGDNVD